MSRVAHLIAMFAFMVGAAAPARAETLIAAMSSHQILITSN